MSNPSAPRRVVLSLLAALAALAGGGQLAGAEVRKGDRAADFVQVVDGAGRRVSLKSFRDRVVVLTFGASWCEPCKRELPAMEKLARRYEQRSARVVFLAVNIDNEVAKGRKFMQQAGLRAVRAIYDTQKSTVETYDPPKMPSTFIIRGGVVRHVHAGFSAGDEAALGAAIDGQLRSL
ncbi:MAG TPA: TlpA disulfide reductase family protein [Kofleriaceae bacterium]|nr:TlpA disulfide reductase family protein [Kofleriaceae bacterium]